MGVCVLNVADGWFQNFEYLNSIWQPLMLAVMSILHIDFSIRMCVDGFTVCACNAFSHVQCFSHFRIELLDDYFLDCRSECEPYKILHIDLLLISWTKFRRRFLVLNERFFFSASPLVNVPHWHFYVGNTFFFCKLTLWVLRIRIIECSREKGFSWNEIQFIWQIYR